MWAGIRKIDLNLCPTVRFSQLEMYFQVIHRSWSFTEELVVAVFVLNFHNWFGSPTYREGTCQFKITNNRTTAEKQKTNCNLMTAVSVILQMILFYYRMDGADTACKWTIHSCPVWNGFSGPFVPISAGCDSSFY